MLAMRNDILNIFQTDANGKWLVQSDIIFLRNDDMVFKQSPYSINHCFCQR